MWRTADIRIVRKVDPLRLGAFEEADAEDGILLNHAYFDMRGQSVEEARNVVSEEAELLSEIEAMGDDAAKLEEIFDQILESCSDLSAFDIGMAGAVYALSAAGAAPISSCNGGLLGECSHSSDVPHILFSTNVAGLDRIMSAASKVGVGLINNTRHVEVYADCIPKLNQFADRLLCEIESVYGVKAD